MTQSDERRAQKRQMKSAARLYAVQALFQMEASGQTVEAITQEFETHRFGAVYDEEEMVEGDVDHFRALIDHAVDRAATQIKAGIAACRAASPGT